MTNFFFRKSGAGLACAPGGGAGLLLQRHGVAKVFGRVGNTTAVETNELRFVSQAFNFFEQTFTHQHAKMTLVRTLANCGITHGNLR